MSGTSERALDRALSNTIGHMNTAAYADHSVGHNKRLPCHIGRHVCACVEALVAQDALLQAPCTFERVQAASRPPRSRRRQTASLYAETCRSLGSSLCRSASERRDLEVL